MKALAEQHQMSEGILYDTALPVPVVTAVCCVAVVIFAVLFWRERARATRPVVLLALFIFRVFAVAGIWVALMNPTAVQKSRQTDKKQTAVYLDASASMNLQDSGGNRGNAARWRATSSGASPDFGSLDGALALLAAASVNVSQAAAVVSSEEVASLLKQADESAEEALERIGETRGLPGMDARIAPLANQLEAEVITPINSLRQLVGSAAGTRESSRASMETLARRIRDIRREVGSLIDGLPMVEKAAERASEPTRMDYARRWLTKEERGWLGRLARETTLLKGQFAQAATTADLKWTEVQAADLNDTAAVTNLQTVLNELGHRAEAGQLDLAVMVTDGAHNVAEQPLIIPDSLARTPLVIVPFGDYEPQRDLDLRAADVPQRILLGDQLTVKARILAHLSDGEVTVVELINGQQVLDSKELRFEEAHSERAVELHWQPSSPQTCDLTVRVRPIEREASLANNERTVKVSVIKDDLSVLVVDSLPRWETRYLFSLFRRENQSKATTLLFEPVHGYAGRQPPPQPALPLTLEAWQQFQVVILGDLNPSQLTLEHQKVVRSYVEKGGHLVVIAGAEAMPEAYKGSPIAEILPVLKDSTPLPPSGFSVKLTPEGLTSDVLRLSDSGRDVNAAMWASTFNVLPLYDVSPWSKPKDSARVLIETVARVGQGIAPRAFLATHPYGRGSVTFISSPSTHSLRWKTGDRYHYRFWGQLVRALAANEFGSGTPGIRISTDKSAYLPGEEVRVKLRLQSNKGAPLKGSSGQIAAYQLGNLVARTTFQPNPEVAGEYEGTLQGLPNGEIKLMPEGGKVAEMLKTLGADAPQATVSVAAGASSLETLPLSEPPPFFSMVEQSPFGMVVAPDAVSTVLKHLDFSPVVTETTRRRPLWNEWWLLYAIAGCLSLEWLGRKFAGLV